ncbi:2OG-Fe(II) oxygenase [Ignatzschineria indica]|uniref:2OG-Fe(II) oxygenase n=1 Tax=Ignatzschineria indica TaxID=472583 RepID=UPI00257751EA|nr:2OG-Fe(II) oxygenase [Ignatzschineria indica]MDM1545566.1 2OG-Fe(II) oxygenase [Ignatzschineria indica]
MKTDNLIDALTTQGYYVWDDFLTPFEVADLKEAIPEDQLQEARIGHRHTLQGNREIRGDLTLWLDPTMGEPIAQYFKKMEEIQQSLNQTLYLGLRDFETHFCRYPSGAYYKRHNDNARNQNRRKVTTVLYLNESWQPGDGGELLIYSREKPESDEVILSLPPQAGSMILFLSEDFPHEVLPTQKIRESITGWYLTERFL